MRLLTSFTLTLCFSAVALQGQSPLRLNLNERASDDKSRKMQAIIPVFRNPKNPFLDFSTFGLSDQEDTKTFNVVMPDLSAYKDTAYGYMYFGGAANPQMSGYLFMMLVQNKRDTKPCIIWTDKNDNFNLTDDGAPDTMKYDQAYLDITISNPAVKGASYTCRLSRFDINSTQSKTKMMFMLDEYYKTNSGKRKFAGAFYSFKEQRLNIRAADYISGKDSFRIALKDVNCNGIYDEPGKDLILLGKYKAEEVGDVIFEIDSKQGHSFFERNGKRFDIAAIDKTGQYIDIKGNSSAPLTRQLNTGRKLPKIKFTLVGPENKMVKLRKYRRKPTYIYFWNINQASLKQDTADLRKLQQQFGNSINIITLNYGQTPKELQQFKENNNINWLMGISSKAINDKFFIEEFPQGYYAVKKLRLKQIGLSPGDLLKMLSL